MLDFVQDSQEGRSLSQGTVAEKLTRLILVDQDRARIHQCSQWAQVRGLRLILADLGDALTEAKAPDLLVVDDAVLDCSFAVLAGKLAQKGLAVLLMVKPERAGEAVHATHLGLFDYLVKRPGYLTDLTHHLSRGLRELLQGWKLKALGDLELKHQEQRKHWPDLVFRLDPSGRLTYVSGEIQTYGLARAELLGRPILEMVHPQDLELARHHFSESGSEEGKKNQLKIRLSLEKARGAQASGLPLSFKLETEGIYEKKKGQTLWTGTQIRAQRLTDEEKVAWQRREGLKNPAGAERYSRNLVDQAFKAGMAEVATLSLERMSHLFSHINTSGQLIHKGANTETIQHFGKANRLLVDLFKQMEIEKSNPRALQLLEYYQLMEEELAAEHQELLENTSLLMEQVKEIRGLLRVQEYYARPSGMPQKMDLALLIGDCLALLDPELANHLSLEGDLKEHQSVVVPRRQMTQVLVNLLQNAWQAVVAMGQEARIRLQIQLEAGWIRIRISDNGCGIAAEDLPRLFIQGFTTKPGGHGFGLFACIQALIEINGRLQVESQGPGRGACFTVELPGA